MHMRRRSKSTTKAAADEAVVGFIQESVRKHRLANLKAEASQHKFCISMTAYLAGCIALNQVLLLAWPVAGAVATVAALVGFAVLAMRSRRARPVAIAASVLPAATMSSLALPQGTVLAQAGVLYGVVQFLTVAYLLTMPEAKTKQARMPWGTIFRWLPLAVAGGAGVGALGYAMLHTQLSLGPVSMPVAAAALACFAVVEELYFRGFLQRLTRKAVGPTLSVALAAIAYTALTLPFGNVAITGFAALASVLISLLYYARPSIALTIAANLAVKLTFVGLLALN